MKFIHYRVVVTGQIIGQQPRNQRRLTAATSTLVVANSV